MPSLLFLWYVLVSSRQAFLSHRIHHICTTPMRPLQLSAKQRVLIRMPSIVLLLNSFWGLFVAMCRDTTTPSAQTWLPYLRWLVPTRLLQQRTDYEALLWSTFLSACVSYCVALTARCLQHTSQREDPFSFNLIGFGIMLCMHSSVPEMKPNAHIYLILLMSIVELLGINLLRCWSRSPVSRLTFTSVQSMVLLLHYLYTSFSSKEYPPFYNAFRFFETSTIFIVVSTLGLIMLTQYLTMGHVRPLHLGLPSTAIPRSTDDFYLALLRLGSECMQMTRLQGLGRELPAPPMPLHTYVELSPDGHASLEHGLENLEHMATSGWNGYANEVRDIRVKAPEPIDSIAGMHGSDKMHAAWQLAWDMYQLLAHVLSTLYGYVSPYLPPIPQGFRRIPRYVRLFWHGRNGEARREARLARASEERREQEARLKQAQAMYEAFQRRQLIRATYARHPHAPQAWSSTDDLDPIELISLASDLQETPFQDVLLKHMIRPDHTPPLTRSAYRQIMQAVPRGPASDLTGWDRAVAPQAHTSPVVQAPMASDQHTRAELLRILQAQRSNRLTGLAGSELDRERTRLCVVCCCEQRTIINWPCRCIALCDECREALSTAGRKSDSMDPQEDASFLPLCPTCRTPVAAFSRLYLP